MTERDARELDWLKREVALAARLTDDDRVGILEDLWRTAQAIRCDKSSEELRREENARRLLEASGKRRYRELAERLG